MKWGIVILLLGLLSLLCACGTRPYPSSLLTADSLASVRPDSALSLLKALERDTADMPLAHRMYYRLLCVKAADKAYLPHLSDSLIRPILHYYIKEGDPRLLPEAYYYAGRVYRDLGDAPQALDYFEQSLKAMRKHENLEVKNKVYAQMGTLFLYQDMYPEALEAFKQSYRCDVALGDSVGMIFSYRDIADAYRNLNKPDSAIYCYEQACELSLKTQRIDMLRDVQSQLASLYIALGKYDLAYTSLQNALNKIEEPNRSGIYSIASKYYNAVGRTDSAIWYNKELLSIGSVYAKKNATRFFAEFARTQNDIAQALHYFDEYCFYADSVERLNSREEVRRMYALYNYQLREKENRYLQAENARKTQEQFILFAVTLITISLLIAFYFYYRHRKAVLTARALLAEQLQEDIFQRSKQFKIENEKKTAQLEAQIEALQHQLQDTTTAKEQLEKQKELIVYTTRQIELEQDKRKIAEALFFQSDIYLRFKKYTNSSHASRLTDKDWENLQTKIDECFDRFTYKLYGLYRLSQTELHICLLLKAQFRNKEIASLINLSDEGITSIRRRLYAKMFKEKGDAKKLNEFISSL